MSARVLIILFIYLQYELTEGASVGIPSSETASAKEIQCGLITPVGDGLVADGPSSKPAGLPWYVSIYQREAPKAIKYYQVCSGSLVSNKIVISLATCFWDLGTFGPFDLQEDAEIISVAVGKKYSHWDDERDADIQKSFVKEIHLPENFHGPWSNFEGDLGVVILVTPIVYHKNVRPVCLNFETDFEKQLLGQGRLGKMAGHRFPENVNSTWENVEVNRVLKLAELSYIDRNTCIDSLPEERCRERITPDKFCAKGTGGNTICYGDDGSGLAIPNRESGVDRYYLWGLAYALPITKHPENHLCINYAMFTQITKFKEFIKKNL